VIEITRRQSSLSAGLEHVGIPRKTPEMLFIALEYVQLAGI
jgi:hypothetical protein